MIMMSGDGGGKTANIHEIFLQQPTELEVPLIGNYKQVLKFMPDDMNYCSSSYSDYVNATPEGHFFALIQMYQAKRYALGAYNGDEYLGINAIYNSGIYTHSVRYKANAEYTKTYLSQKDTLISISAFTEPSVPRYNSSNMRRTSTTQITWERVSYTENGDETVSYETPNFDFSFGGLTFYEYPYVDGVRIAQCIDEYAHLCNDKYHGK